MLGTTPIQEKRHSEGGVGEVKAIETYPEQLSPASPRWNKKTPRSNPLLTLQEEHDVIRRHSHALVEASRQALGNEDRTGSRESVAHQFAKLQRLLTNHVRNEQRILLPIMAEYFDTEAADEISSEHAELMAGLKRLSDHISAPKHVQSQWPVEGFVNSAADFDSMVRAHFSREENVIYWFANLCLSKRSDL